MSRSIIESFEITFRAQKRLADGAIAQIADADLHTALDPETNSIAVIMRHVTGNLRSRFTDFLTTDGEKPWRDRDTEFIERAQSRSELVADWESGWFVLFSSLAGLTDADLGRTITIRGEPHSVALALARSLAHMGYHSGQIVQACRALASRAGTPWNTLTIPRGGSAAHNAAAGYRIDRLL